VAGDYAYVAGNSKLYILAADDLETTVAIVNELWDIKAVDVSGDYVYVACNWHGLRIIDISTLGSPKVLLGNDGSQGYKIQDQSWYHNVFLEEKNGKVYAYAVGSKEGGINFLEIMDVSDPAAPDSLGNVDVSNEDWPSAVKVSGNHAYVAYGWNGLKIYDISNPSSIVMVGKIDGLGSIRDLVLGSTYAYLAAEWDGMRVVDISNPAIPVLAATYATNDSNKSFRGIDKQDDYVYLTSYSGDKVALDIINVSSPLSPQAVDAVKVDGSSNDIMGVNFSGNFVYAAFGSGGVKAFSSLTVMAEKGTAFSFETPVIQGSSFQLDAGPAGMSINPDTGVVSWASPDQKEDGTSLYELTISYQDASSNNKTLNYFLWIQNVNTAPAITAVDETLAWKYGVQNSYQVEVVDADTAVKGYNESFTFSVDNASAQKGVAINGKGLLTWNPAADQTGEQTITVKVQDKAGATDSQDFTVKVFNINQAPMAVGRIKGLVENARIVKVQGNYAYVLDNNSMRILDIADINNPVKVGSAPCSDPRDLVLSGKYAYMADSGEGLRVVDISDKTAPKIVATFKSMTEGSWCHYESLAISGNYAYLAGEREQQRVMDVVDISDPTGPSLVQPGSSYEVSNQNNANFESIKVSGNYAYLAQGWNGLTILDVSNPGNITKAGGLQNIGWSRDLVLDPDGGYVYMAADWDGLKVVDITDPANPKVVGQFNPNDIWSQGIDINGDYVYLASQTNQGGQLDIIDISDPYTPLLSGSIAGETDSFNQVDVEDDLLYVAGGSGGVTVLSTGAVQAAEETGLSFEVPVIGGSSFAIDAASTAKGIVIDSTTGVLTWDAPSNVDVGLHQVVVSYTLSDSSKSETYPIWVQNLNQPPQIAASESTLAWILSVKNHFTLQISDEDLNAPGYIESFVFQVDATSSAKGISVDSSGNVVWNPVKSDVGEHELIVTVTDAAGAATQQTFKIQVFDLNLSPVQVGMIDEQLTNVRGLVAEGNYAYVLDNNRLNIYYVNNVNSPELVGGIRFSPGNDPENFIGNPRDITLSGKYVYVALEWGGLQIIDITNKSAPSALISEVNDDYGQHYFKTGSNHYQTITISGDYAYTSGQTESGGNGYNFLEVIDISNPELPVSKGKYLFTGANIESIKVFEDYVIAAAGWEGLRTFEVSDPTEIQPAGTMQTNQQAYDLAVDSKGYAYLANEWGGLKIIDISDPEDPSFAGGLGVSLNYNARSIDIFGNYAYLAGNKPEGAVLSIIDISDPLSPKLVNNLEVDTDHVFDQVDFTRAYAFVGSGADGVRIISPQTVMAREGEILSFEIPLVNAVDYTFALDGVSSQKGMTVDTTGNVNWDTPVNADVGLHEVAAVATDAVGSASKLTYQVWVENVNQAPAFAAGMATTLDWYWNVTNTFQLPIQDDDLYAPGYQESFTYGIDVSQVTGDTKPVIDNNTGVIVWTPDYKQKTGPGKYPDGYPVTITVTDAAGETIQTEITLTIKDPDVPYGSDYHTPENAMELKTTGKPITSSLIEENDVIQPDWFTFTLEENNKLLLSFSTQGQSDYLIELVSGQTDMTLPDLLADNKGIIYGNVAVSDADVVSWEGIIGQARGLFLKDGYLFSALDNELDVYSMNQGPVEMASTFLGVGPFVDVKLYQGHTYARTENCLTWEQANTLAEKAGGYLAVVDGQEENQFFADNYAGNFIGYNDIAAEGSWVLADGEPAGFTNWSEGQPDDSQGNEDVAQIMQDGTWNDVPDNCGHYIIEWDNVKTDDSEKAWFNSTPQMSDNLIVLSGNNWDDDLQKSVTYKGAVDISDPGSPKWLGQINEGEVRSQWTTQGGYIYSASDWQDGSDKVYVYHVSDNGLTQVNMLEGFNANTRFLQVMAGDNLLLIKAYNGPNPHLTDKWGNPIHHCLFVYDLTDPASPVLINVIEAGENGADWNIVTVSKGYVVFNKLDGSLASFDLEDLQTCSGFGTGQGEIQSIGSATTVNNNQINNNLTSPIMYLPDNMGNAFDAVHMAENGQLKRLISIKDKGYLKAVMPGGQSFLAASTAVLNSETIYSLYHLEVQEGAWVYESFEVKSGTQAQANGWEPQQEEEDSFGYDSVAVGLEPGTYYVKVSDAGDFDSTQKYALSCSVEEGFTGNAETQTVPISETPSVYEDFISSLIDINKYLFTVEEDLQAFLEFENPSFSSDYTFTLVNDSLWSQEQFSLLPGQDLISSFNVVAGDYSLLVENTSVVDALSDYTLSFSTLETDGSKETEPNNDYSTANAYIPGETFTGHIAHDADDDYFVLNLDQSKILDIEMSVLKASKGSFRLDLILSGVVIDTMNVEAGTFETFNLGLFPGRYFIRISGSGADSTDEYSFTLTEIQGVDQEFEPNNEKQFANSISDQMVKQGRLYGNGDVDWYAFNCIETGLFVFDFYGQGDAQEKYHVQILNMAGTSIMKFQVDGNQSNSDMKGLYPGNYYIRISGSAVTTGKYAFKGIGQIVELKELLTLRVSSEKDVYEIDKDQNLQLTAAANYSDGSVADVSSTAEWKSLNTDVASVSTNGLVTGLKGGSATIAVAYGDKETKTKTASYTVNVIDPDNVMEKFSQTYGNLIIVAGGGVHASNKLADTTQSLCDYVYMKFKGRGFEDEDIYYFNPVAYKDLNGNGFDDQIVDQTSVTTDTFFGSINTWAEKYPTNGPLYIYLNDHGAEDMFQLYPGQILTASQFASSLDQFQAATGRKVVVIIEACHSGTFVDNLQAQDRLVVTSSGDGLSYLGNNGAASFSMFFMDALYKGSNILTAYDDSLIKLAGLGKPYSMMDPKYEDQGGQLSDLYVVGDFALAPLFAEIIEVNLQTAYVIGSGGMNIQAQVTGAEGGSVWATLKPLDYEPPPVVGDFLTPQIQFPSITLVDEKQEQFDQVYEGTSDELVVNGEYEVVIFAKDSEGNVTKSPIYEVSVTGSSNDQWPQPAFDYLPVQIQAGDKVFFTDASTDDGSIVSWLWDFGDETSAADQHPTHTYNQAGAYTVTLTVTDDHGAENNCSALVTVGGTDEQIEMGVAAGWNLLSSRLSLSVGEKFSDGDKFSSVWKWQDEGWAVYLPGESDGGAAYASAKGFTVLTTIHPGEGFWVNATAPETVTISGIAASGSLFLSDGWNLAGLKGDQGKSVTSLISGNENNIASIWKWQSGGWAVYLPGEDDGGQAYAAGKSFAVLTSIEPGEGFWVNATQQITLD
jgi:plastocyanin